MVRSLREIEIREIPTLAPEQAALLDSHSVLNVLNVLVGELALLGFAFEDKPELFRDSLARCNDLVVGLGNSSQANVCLGVTEACATGIEAELLAMAVRHAGRLGEPSIADGLRNISSVLEILRVRAREVLARARHPQLWEPFLPATLRRGFVGVFSAMEHHSRHRFRIVYSPLVQTPRDYYVELDFDPADEALIWMPPVLVDVMRDLIANARKYTAPGGWIAARLEQSPEELRFSVQDSGRGIPRAELAQVVAFGQRGSNAADIRTLGGGFGLTKAFAVTRQFLGRFWIASEEGVGTRIRLSLPRPDPAVN